MIVTNSLTGGGAERSMNLVCNELTIRGWPISLVPINSSGTDQVIPICEVFPIDRRWQGTLRETVKAIFKFYHIVRSWDPDIIVLNCDLPELFGAVLFGKRKFFVIEHSNIPWVQRIRLGRIVRRILTYRDATWGAVSSHLSIWPSGRMPSVILENPLALPQQSKTEFDVEAIRRLIYIGRLSPEKCPNLLIEIGEQTGLEVEFFGDGIMREELQTKASNGKVRVLFHGQVQNPWGDIRSGDLLIVPSANEGDGLVVLEGLQKEIPMLLADIPDFRRFGFSDRNYCKTVDSYVSRINDCRNDSSKLTIPSSIANEILRSRSISIVASAWERFLNSL